MVTPTTHRRSDFPLYQPEQLESPYPPTIHPATPQETNEPSLLQKMWSLFCCCSCSEPTISEPEPAPPAKTYNFDDLLFERAETGEKFHYVMRPLRKQDFFTDPEEDPKETLYQRLNHLDYTEVRRVIAAHHSLLSQEKRERLATLLDEMYNFQPFLNPKTLSQKISDLPPKLLSEITEQASLAAIHATGTTLISTCSSPVVDPYQNLDEALKISYIFPSRHQAFKLTGRYPRNLQQKADCIRWGALHHYHREFIPESMNQSITETTEDLMLDHKHHSTTEELSPTSLSYQSGFDKDPSLEILPVDNSLQSQFTVNALTTEPLKDSS